MPLTLNAEKQLTMPVMERGLLSCHFLGVFESVWLIIQAPDKLVFGGPLSGFSCYKCVGFEAEIAY